MSSSSPPIFLVNQMTTHSTIKPSLYIHPYFTSFKLAQAHCLNRCSTLIAQELSSGTYISHKTWHRNGRDQHIIFGKPTVHCLEILPLPPDEDRRYVVLEISLSTLDHPHSLSSLVRGWGTAIRGTNKSAAEFAQKFFCEGEVRKTGFDVEFDEKGFVHYIGSVVGNGEVVRYAWIDVVLVEKAEERDCEVPGDGEGYVYDCLMEGAGDREIVDCERGAGITDAVYDQLLAKFADLDINEEEHVVGKAL